MSFGTHPSTREPTPQQAATLPKREGEREGSRKVCLLDVASSKSHLHRPINFLSTICLPSRFGRVAACCGVGSQVSGWIPKGIACCGMRYSYLQELLGSLYFGLCQCQNRIKYRKKIPSRIQGSGGDFSGLYPSILTAHLPLKSLPLG